MRRMFALAVVAFAPFAPAIYAQTASPSGLISNADLPGVLKRSVQLMESTSAAVPGLVRAAAPVTENARQLLINIEAAPAGHAGLLYDLVLTLRSYVTLSDQFPKPSPFPEEARRQFSELRDTVDQLQAHFRARVEQLNVQSRSPDPDALNRYAEANVKLTKPSATEKRVVFMGDSITDGWRLNEYFPGRDFVNRGISGQTSIQMLGRMKADVIDLQPAAILILAGTNDISRGTPLSTIENNLVMMADLADTYKIKVLIASVLPVSDYHKDVNPRYEMTKLRPLSTIQELNRWIQAFCKQRNYSYVDYHSQLVDSSGQLKTDLADDGLHPEASGYRVMAPIALEAIDRLLVKTVPAPVSKKRPSRTPVEAKPEPVQAAAPRTEPAAVKPLPPAPATPAPAAKKAETPAVKKAETPKPVQVEATTATPDSSAPAAAPKKKKEPFWKRTYPTTPPPLSPPPVQK